MTHPQFVFCLHVTQLHKLKKKLFDFGTTLKLYYFRIKEVIAINMNPHVYN